MRPKPMTLAQVQAAKLAEAEKMLSDVSFAAKRGGVKIK